jgi:hypothetical protein
VGASAPARVDAYAVDGAGEIGVPRPGSAAERRGAGSDQPALRAMRIASMRLRAPTLVMALER